MFEYKIGDNIQCQYGIRTIRKIWDNGDIIAGVEIHLLASEYNVTWFLVSELKGL